MRRWQKVIVVGGSPIWRHRVGRVIGHARSAQHAYGENGVRVRLSRVTKGGRDQPSMRVWFRPEELRLAKHKHRPVT